MDEKDARKAEFGKEPEMPVERLTRLTPAQPVDTGPLPLLAEHTVQNGETLSHLALKYYGSAVKDKWMVIYEANKEAIGENPNHVALGLVLKIPKLPE